MEARALDVAEQPLETEPAEIGGAARGVEREIDGLDRTAGDQRAMDEDRVGGRRSGLRSLGERDHAVERDARRGELGVERAQSVDRRSEERRVGKGGEAGWGAGAY